MLRGKEETVPYNPKPVDTSDVTLADDILELTELLARNTHEVWAQKRMADGWTWGAARDDGAKKHPCLLSYDELPDSEREYDRSTALETLKLIQALGYCITRASSSTASSQKSADNLQEY